MNESKFLKEASVVSEVKAAAKKPPTKPTKPVFI
jgi:hypothetical protein